LQAVVLPAIFELGSSYGYDTKKVIVEFSSPNIAKEFHAGHFRSTIIGAFLSNLYKSSGWEVVRMNYLRDWGRTFSSLCPPFREPGRKAYFAFAPLVFPKDSTD
jgi:arginyl-tRNA synthetase